jgi:hypothetical protein
MRKSASLLLSYGVFVLAIFVIWFGSLSYYAEPLEIWTSSGTLLAEGLGFTGLALVEVSIFLMAKENEAEKVPELTIEFDRNDRDQYTPELRLGTQVDASQTPAKEIPITRRFLKVNVRNRGVSVAEQCKATLRVITRGQGTPSTEPKPLRWDTGASRQDIGAVNGLEPLHVVLSDSRMATPDFKGIFALVATPDAVANLQIIRAQDGMQEGDFEFELNVTSTGGEQATAVFRVHVTRNWQELMMERIS